MTNLFKVPVNHLSSTLMISLQVKMSPMKKAIFNSYYNQIKQNWYLLIQDTLSAFKCRKPPFKCNLIHLILKLQRFKTVSLATVFSHAKNGVRL